MTVVGHHNKEPYRVQKEFIERSMEVAMEIRTSAKFKNKKAK